jgi:hypothetical protein
VLEIPLKASADNQRGEKRYHQKKNVEPISLAWASHIYDLLITRRIDFIGNENLLGVVV